MCTVSGPLANRFGPLRADSEGIFDLPDGFAYRIISGHGDRMNNGFLISHRSDGVATLPGPGGHTSYNESPEVDVEVIRIV